MIGPQPLELAARNGSRAETRQVVRGQLAVDDRECIAAAERHQVRERGLGGIAPAAEHRLPDEPPAQAYAVNTTREHPRVADLDAVRVPEVVQLQIGGAHLARDPGTRT